MVSRAIPPSRTCAVQLCPRNGPGQVSPTSGFPAAVLGAQLAGPTPGEACGLHVWGIQHLDTALAHLFIIETPKVG